MFGTGVGITYGQLLGSVSPVAVAAALFTATADDWTTVSTLPAPSDLSVSRAGNAMLYDSTGKLTYAPNNLLTYSQTLSNAAWAGGGGANAPTKGTTSTTLPDSTVGTVDTITFPAISAGQFSFLYQVLGAPYINQPVIFSVWLRVASGTASIYLNVVDGSAAPSGTNYFSSSAQTLTTSWQRFYILGTRTSNTGNIAPSFGFDTRCAAGQTNGGSLTVQAWGAQFEAVTYQTTPSTYTATTAAAYYGLRNDYNPATLAAKGVLIEGARTNVAFPSQDISAAGYNKRNLRATNWLDQAVAPDGTTTADFMVPDTTNGPHDFYNGLFIGASTSTVTTSVYLKASSAVYTRAYLGDGATNSATFDLSNGSVTTAPAGWAASIASVGNGWYRLAVTYTTAVGKGIGCGILDAAGNATFVGDNTNGIYVWGIQVEVGAFPTSYIPTTTASVTRAAETLNLANYQNRLIEEFYIDEQTGNTYNSLSGPSATSPLAIFTGNGWVTSFRAYNSGAPGTLATPSWLDVSGITGNRMMYDSTGKLTYVPNNLLTYSNTFTNAAWTKTACSLTAGVTDPLGGSNATTLTATGPNASIYVAVTGPAGANFVNSIWVKRRTGTGEIRLFVPNNGSYSVISTTGSWQQFYVTGAGLTYFQIAVVTSGDAIDIYAASASAVTYETAPRAGDNVITTTAAYYGPRFDFDPNTLVARGLLIEESRTNIAQQSQTLTNAFWAPINASITGSAGTAPDGTNTAFSLTANGTTNAHYLNPSSGITWTNTAYTLSVYMKQGTNRYSFVSAFDGTTAFGGVFDLQTGVYVGDRTGAGATVARITSVGNGWYRCAITFTPAAASASFAYQLGTNNNGSLGLSDASSGNILLWGVQSEVGSFPTSYIPTTTASVTRVADIIKLSGAALTAVQGTTHSIVGETSALAGTAAGAIVGQGNSAAINVLQANKGSSNVQAYAAGSALIAGSAINWLNTNRVAYGNGTGRSLVINNGTLTSDASTMSIGANPVNVGSYYTGVDYINGYLRGVSIYDQRLSNATLQAKSVVGSAY